MKIRAAMVEYLLSRNGAPVQLHGDPEMAISHVRTYQRGAHREGALQVSFELEEKERLSIPDDAAVLEWLTGTQRKGGKHATPHRQDSECVEAAYDALRALDAWEAQLKDALLHGATLDEFIEIGQAMLSCPAAYFDCNLIVLAASADYWSRSSILEGGDAGVTVEGQMPSNRAADLVEDFDYLRAAEHEKGFYYEDARHYMYYGINTFDGGEYLARLVFALPEGAARLHRGEEQLIECYHEYLDDLHLRFAGNANVASSQNDALHGLVRTAVVAGSPQDSNGTAAVLASRGWTERDDFVVAKLVFFEGVHWDSVSLYLCGLLERMMNHSCALPFEQQIVWLVNLTRSGRAGETQQRTIVRFSESLVDLLRNYACKAGISDVFTDFSLAHNYYLQAEHALAIGQVKDPHYWYYWFRDYAFDYMLSACTNSLPPMLTCHPALVALAAHDTRHGTDYAKTLVCFLRNSQNTTHAANELFIHRTSFMRRMAQIQKVAQIDLDDPNQVLHLLLSAKLLGL